MSFASAHQWQTRQSSRAASFGLPLGACLGLCFGLALSMSLASSSRAQSHPAAPSLPTLPSGVPANSREDYDIPGNDPAEQQRQMRALNIERQKRVVSDSNKLLKLTTELNADIARTNSDSLTSSQLRKLAEIEKTARNLKERLTSAEQPTTGITLDPRLR
jgi:hypothetical protein